MFTNLQLIHLPKAEPLRLGVFARVNFFERSLRNKIFFFSSAAAEEFFLYLSQRRRAAKRDPIPLAAFLLCEIFSLRLGGFARVNFFFSSAAADKPQRGIEGRN
jgi:hypothetical protein